MKTRRLVNYSSRLSLQTEEIADIPEMRTAVSKSYRNNNGSYSAVIFGEPIHYLDKETNSYKEIDNSFELCDAGKSLINKRNRFSAKFASVFGGDYLAINQDEYEILISAITDNKSKIRKNGSSPTARLDYKIKSKQPHKQNLTNNFKSSKKVNNKSLHERRIDALQMTLASALAYENIQDGIDLRYDVTPRKIKEDIIINKIQDKYEYTFEFKLKNLTVKLNEKGSVHFCSTINDTIVFTIPAPFMYDDTGKVSDAVTYDIDSTKKNKCIIKVIADAQWINDNERTFPVIIDPQIISNDVSSINIESYSNGQLVPSSDYKNALGMCYGTLYDLKVDVTAPNYLDAFDNQTLCV